VCLKGADETLVGAFRRALVRTIRFFIVRPAALLGAAVALVVVVAAITVLPSLLPSLVLGIAAGRTGVTGAAPPATEEYLRGNRDYDASLMWESLSDDARQRLTGQGGSSDDLQRQMQAAKDRGTKLEEISYIGGKALPDGRSVEFYLVGIRPQAKADIDYQPYTFTLDRDGKITRVQ